MATGAPFALGSGARIESVTLGFRLVIVISSDAGRLEVAIESPLTLTTADKHAAIDPGTWAGHAELLAALVSSAVTSLSATDDGDLTISLADGRQIVVPSDDDFEAWTIAGPSGPVAVALPGGGVETWS